MNITLAAVGRMRSGPARDLFDDYVRRLSWRLDVKEVEEKRPLPPEKLKQREAELLLGACPDRARMIALDERGKDLSSADLARLIGGWRDDGDDRIAFVIGGTDGLADDVRRRCDRTIAFGRATWPHMMVRVLLAEQLYRAQQILAGHPYHRE